MKYIIILCITFTILSCSKNQYEINGIVKNNNSKYIYLIKKMAKEYDTISKVRIKNNSFYTRGSVDELEKIIVKADSVIGIGTLYLENTEYNLELNKHKFSIKGGISQSLFDKSNSIKKDFYTWQNSIRDEYFEAANSNRHDKIKDLKDSIKEHKTQYIKNYVKFLDENKDKNISMYLISNDIELIEYHNAYNIFTKSPKSIQSTRIGKRVQKMLKDINSTNIGSIAPDFTLKNINGDDINLHSINAKVKILDFWASWCESCRAKHPEMLKIYRDYNKLGLEIISVSLDHIKDKWVQASKNDKIIWHNVSDLKRWESKAAKKYLISYVPRNFILDENNRIIYRDLDNKRIRIIVDSILRKHKQ